jgi:hypothetical protein
MTLSTVLSQASNGNGAAVNGRGLRHRKMTRREAVKLAVDIASGRPFLPSLHHLADIFGVPVASLSKEVKARAVAQEASATSAEEDSGEVEVDDMKFPVEEVLSVLSPLTQAWYAASPVEREDFLREEIVSRVIC